MRNSHVNALPVGDSGIAFALVEPAVDPGSPTFRASSIRRASMISGGQSPGSHTRTAARTSDPR